MTDYIDIQVCLLPLAIPSAVFLGNWLHPEKDRQIEILQIGKEKDKARNRYSSFQNHNNMAFATHWDIYIQITNINVHRYSQDFSKTNFLSQRKILHPNPLPILPLNVFFFFFFKPEYVTKTSKNPLTIISFFSLEEQVRLCFLQHSGQRERVSLCKRGRAIWWRIYCIHSEVHLSKCSK